MTDMYGRTDGIVAFVIKNYAPVCNKVEILHKKYGKIVCIYPKKHQAALLTTGSLIVCEVEKMPYAYTFSYLFIEKNPLSTSAKKLHFIHDIMKLCMSMLPFDVCVPELFDFLFYVYGRFDQLSDDGRKIVLLRLFLLLDLLPEHHDAYQAAVQDPYDHSVKNTAILEQWIVESWDKFHHENQ